MGSYFSGQPADPALWDLPRFVKEVRQVVNTLALQDFCILGHSWGAALLIEYALQHPEGLKGVIFSNMMSNMDACEQYTKNGHTTTSRKLCTLSRRQSFLHVGG